MVAVCVGVPENEQIENRRDYHGERFHLFPLMQIIALLIEHLSEHVSEHLSTQRTLSAASTGWFLLNSVRVASDWAAQARAA